MKRKLAADLLLCLACPGLPGRAESPFPAMLPPSAP